MTDKWVLKCVFGRNKNKSNDQVKFAAKKINAQFIAYELSITMVVTFGEVLNRNQRP